MEEQFYTVAEAAEILKVSTDKITKMFEDEPETQLEARRFAAKCWEEFDKGRIY